MTTKVIAEIGINHKGNMDIAKQLIDAAHAAGAWAVKFQYRDQDTFYAQTNEIGDEILIEEIRRINMTASQYDELRDYAQNLGILAGISFFRIQDAAHYGTTLAQYDFFKIPSAELENAPLLDYLLAFNKQVILSTGGHSEQRILQRLQSLAGYNVIVLHCVANYPLLLGNQNLAFMQKMAQSTDLPIGYSSHDEDWEACIVAATLGAEYIERHLTTDKKGGGLDDSTSSDIPEFNRLCRIVNKMDNIVGTGKRVINQGEIINMQNLGTSLYALQDFTVGQKVSVDDFAIQAPRKGLTRAEIIPFIGQALIKPIASGQPITEFHFVEQFSTITSQEAAYCDMKKLSVPIRLHDAAVIAKNVPIENYELHFSYGEINQISQDINALLKYCKADCAYSIHLPDYLYGNRLIDPISTDSAIRQDSRLLISQVRDMTQVLTQLTSKPVPIVGSFSRLLNNDHTATLDHLFDYFSQVETSYFKILPQWLPAIAWYFGGAETLELFCKQRDVDYIVKNNARICLDISHLILSANYANVHWYDWYKALAPFTDHLHVADAQGIDGEGVKFGTGELEHLDEILDFPVRKVLEVWQGHLNEGSGFVEAIKFLKNNHD